MNAAQWMARSLLREVGPRILAIRRRTWILIAAGLALFAALALWAVLALAGWAFGLAREGLALAPDAARGAVEYVERQVPGAARALDELRAIGTLHEPVRDVGGTDIGPVPRYPGLARSHWQREGNEVTVRYEGPADYTAVLDHYVAGFAAQGYTREVLHAARSGETHEYRKANHRVVLSVTRLPEGGVEASLVAAPQ
ncbi:MAG: hypothetical protein AB7Q97_05330 [Gammaproteobacteria bacterium]